MEEAQRSIQASAQPVKPPTAMAVGAVTTTAGSRLVGKAMAIDAEGHLQLEVDGVVSAVAAGDVEHLRAR